MEAGCIRRALLMYRIFLRETVVTKGDSLFTRYDGRLLPVRTRTITVRYKQGEGVASQTFTTYHTVHGPVMGSRDGKWLSLRENNRSLNALQQSWLRTRTKGFADFKKVMELRSNTSDNTLYADYQGNIAYWHGNFVPIRNKAYDYSLPVDGTVSASDWHGMYPLGQIVHVYNPATGFIQNCNATPFTVSGASSPKKENYPVSMAPDGENFRGINAVRLLSNAHDLTLTKMITEVGYNHHLTYFDTLLPVVVHDFHLLPVADSLRHRLAEPVAILQAWDRNSADTSVATAIAIEFGYRILQKTLPLASPYDAGHLVSQLQQTLQVTSARERLRLLSETLTDLENRFGTWHKTWGEINRYQRPPDGRFADDKPSLPVGLGSSNFGSLPSFASRHFGDTNKRYGYNGNSFVACVQFGKRVNARSVITGGQSFNPASPHYDDQAKMYIDGNFKRILFYKDEVVKHAENQYHPGEWLEAF